tara:strand:+ start:296 stop:493 length:198 start_codon:yes stop_codon:yes gene_type:complete
MEMPTVEMVHPIQLQEQIHLMLVVEVVEKHQELLLVEMAVVELQQALLQQLEQQEQLIPVVEVVV